MYRALVQQERLKATSTNHFQHEINETTKPEVLQKVDVVEVDDVVVDEVAVVVLRAAGMMTGSTRSSGARSGSWDQFCLLRALIDDCNSDTSVACTVTRRRRH